MRSKFNSIKIIAIAMIISSIIFAPEVSAKTEPYGAFFVDAHLPENQYDKEVGYFDLMMNESQEQTLSFDITNQGDEKMTATISFNNGSTDVNAVKTYKKEIEPDDSMIVPMTDMAKLNTTVVSLMPNQTETVTIDVKAPDKTFDGVSVGGVVITADYENTDEREDNDNIEVKNRLSYLLAVQIRMTENKLSQNLNYKNSTAELVNVRPQFVSYIQNDQAVVMNNVTIQGSVSDLEGKQVASVNVVDGGILPNTEFMVAYELEEKKIEAGNYNIKLKISTEEDEWEWEDTVVVEEKKAEDLNEASLDVEKKDNNILLYVVIALLIILILLVLLLVLKKRRED